MVRMRPCSFEEDGHLRISASVVATMGLSQSLYVAAAGKGLSLPDPVVATFNGTGLKLWLSSRAQADSCPNQAA